MRKKGENDKVKNGNEINSGKEKFISTTRDAGNFLISETLNPYFI